MISSITGAWRFLGFLALERAALAFFSLVRPWPWRPRQDGHQVAKGAPQEGHGSLAIVAIPSPDDQAGGDSAIDLG